MPTTNDLLGLAIDKNPVDFADTFNQIIMQKAQDAVEAKRIELAQAIYGEEQSDEDDDLDIDDVGEDEFDADDDTDDLDDDDLDFDVDDLDLDDIDLEDLTDDEDA